MVQTPLSLQQLRRTLKARRPLKKPTIRITFEPPPRPQRAGIRVFPASVKGTFVKRLARPRIKAAGVTIDESKLQGFLPNHLALNPHKPLMEKRFRRAKFFDPIMKLKRGQYMATTIFPPDQRYAFSDTSFPWCTTGKVMNSSSVDLFVIILLFCKRFNASSLYDYW